MVSFTNNSIPNFYFYCYFFFFINIVQNIHTTSCFLFKFPPNFFFFFFFFFFFDKDYIEYSCYIMIISIKFLKSLDVKISYLYIYSRIVCVCLFVCLLLNHALTTTPRDTIFCMYIHMTHESKIGYMILITIVTQPATMR